MENFNPYERSFDANWMLSQINRLMLSAKKFSDSSLVLYAALETRNLFERLEFELLAMAAKGTETEVFLNEIRGKTGIQKANNKYKSLKYRYQSFSSAATKAMFEDGSLNKFDYLKSEKYCYELSQYVHTYSRMPEDMLFESEFIRTGIHLIEDSINYLMTEFFTRTETGLMYGVFDFNELTPSVRLEFENWLNSVDKDEEALLQRLIDYNNRENGGIKMRISIPD